MKALKDIPADKIFEGMKVKNFTNEISNVSFIAKHRHSNNRKIVGLKYQDGTIEILFHDSMREHFYAE